jgi:hypothetical protein
MKNGNYVDKDGDTVWVSYGQYHRTDGPAIMFGPAHAVYGTYSEKDGSFKSWWWQGKYCSFYTWLMVNDILSEEDKVMLKLKYG